MTHTWPTRRTATGRRPSASSSSSGSTTATPRVLYKLAFARYNERHYDAAIEALRARARHRRQVSRGALPARTVPSRRAAARGGAEGARTRHPAAAHPAPRARGARGSVSHARTRRRPPDQLEGLTALDPGPSRDVALGLAYARAGQTERAVTTLGRAAERYPEHPYAYVALGRVWLEIAQARGDRVALSKALGALEGAVGQRQQQRGADAVRPGVCCSPRR